MQLGADVGVVGTFAEIVEFVGVVFQIEQLRPVAFPQQVFPAIRRGSPFCEYPMF